MDKVLEIQDLQVDFVSETRRLHALRGITFHIEKGETLGLVGESGCGKSLTALSVMQLIPTPPGEICGGSIMFRGRNLLEFSEKEMRAVRGNKISMIFQEPMTSLNPVFTVGNQLIEVIHLHMNKTRSEAEELAADMLATVGMSDVRKRLKEYPHELSGGLRQRVMIAMALLCQPEILIADEPTTALDVTIQAQIIDLMENLKMQFGTSVLMITHDLGVIAESCSRVAVMYAGVIIEMANVNELFKNPLHPYTRGLLSSIPSLGKRARLTTIKGMVPDLSDMPKGCAFFPRCEYGCDKCLEERPYLKKSNNHYVACWRPMDE
ncbi:ABC transporter ATP-binding protein [Sediminispirochaeta bajacaliforniensis]|uniref:ABC transporter ATP-binding protein n=1 Tax=Sediminispirochaeta bajacaliforniensis TaxID=148 RepID=UPI0003824979|nr:ABC transporter ATP-binding protein [Sediminispirochaeta bajacaliforniensis]